MIIWLDFETRSACPITHGPKAYALDESADILCLAYAFNFDAPQVWRPDIQDVPDDLLTALASPDLEYVYAHNAGFDREIYNIIAVEYGFPDLPLEKWYCTAAHARVNALPAALDKLTRCLGIQEKKDARGSTLIRKLSLPQIDGTFCDDDALMAEMAEYCRQDVVAMRQATLASREMTEYELHDYHTTERINDKGVPVDVDFAMAAIEYAADEAAEIAESIAILTDGAADKHTQLARIKKWLKPLLTPTQLAAVTVNGKLVLDGSARTKLLAFEDLNIPARELVESLDAANKSSVSKYQRMVERQVDGRVYGSLVYAGASQTLRFSAHGLQIHNFTRDTFDEREAEAIRAQVIAGQPIDSPMKTLAKMLRPTIVAPEGKTFVVADWSAIEGRALPYLARSCGDGAQELLDMFENDEDLYLKTCDQLSLPHTERQTGKVAALALGYGGGVGAFNQFAGVYGLDIPDAQANIYVQQWRGANPWAVKFWKVLEQQAIAAMRAPGVQAMVGPNIIFEYAPAANNGLGVLTCTVHEAFVLSYPNPRLDIDPAFGGYALSAIKGNLQPPKGSEDWPRVTLWGGHLAENLTQAFCAALLKDAVAMLDDVIMHVHDEIIIECDSDEESIELAKESITNAMGYAPDWAEGLPLAVEPVVMRRYGGH